MKVSDFTRLYGDSHVNLYRLDYTDRQGRAGTWTLASREKRGPKCLAGGLTRPDAVVIVPYHRTRRQLVLVREYRVALGGYQYGFPAGLIDPGESVAAAARRELFEETGLEVVAQLAESPALFTSSGITDEAVVMAYVTCDGQPSDAGNGASEMIETHFADRPAAQRLCRDATLLMDAKTWLVLSAFAAGLPLG